MKLLNRFARQGIIPISILSQKHIYECYLLEKRKSKKTTKAVLDTAIQTKTSESHIYNIIKKMQS